MKNKKIISVGVLILLLMSMLSGCGNESPKEILEKNMEESIKVKSAKQDFEMVLNFEMENTDPSMMPFIQMLNNIKLKGEFETDSEKMATVGEMEIDLGGMLYKAKMYITPEKSVMKMPMIPKYILINGETNNEQKLNDKEEIIKLSKKLFKVIMDFIDDEKLQKKDNVTLTTENGDIKVTEISMKFKDEDIKALMKEIVPMLLENDSFKKSMYPSIKQQLITEGIEPTEEEIEKKLEEIKDEFNNNFDELDELVTFEKLNLTYSIDKDYHTRKVDFDIKYNINDKSGQAMSLSLKGISNTWNINEPVDIKFPDLNEENSIKIEDLANQFMPPIPVQ
ncbi:MAG: hypothetical protein FH753_13950 [Firmicutes bacterium]|nr:hypothetical protein [Bacillota bacterium]